MLSGFYKDIISSGTDYSKRCQDAVSLKASVHIDHFHPVGLVLCCVYVLWLLMRLYVYVCIVVVVVVRVCLCVSLCGVVAGVSVVGCCWLLVLLLFGCVSWLVLLLLLCELL